MMWNQNDGDIVLTPTATGSPTSPVYRLHSAVTLEEVPEGYEEMYFHLTELRRIANGLADKTPREIVCKLCGMKLEDVLMLRDHITSPEHKRKARKKLIFSFVRRMQDIIFRSSF